MLNQLCCNRIGAQTTSAFGSAFHRRRSTRHHLSYAKGRSAWSRWVYWKFLCNLLEHCQGGHHASYQLFLYVKQSEPSFLKPSICGAHPKKQDPTKVVDYRPISLVHSFARIVTKLLAQRLAPELKHLISANQSAFIKKRCIHNNLTYVHQSHS